MNTIVLDINLKELIGLNVEPPYPKISINNVLTTIL